MRGFAVARKAGAGVVVVDQRKGEGEVGLGDLLEGAQLAGEGQPLPAMLSREFDGVKASGAARLDRLQRIPTLPFPARSVGRHMLFGKSPGTADHGAFLGRENLVQHWPQIHDWTFGATAG